jgi:hypothetical protein
MKANQSTADATEKKVVSEEEKETAQELKNMNAANISETAANEQGGNIKIDDSKEQSNDIENISSSSKGSNTSSTNNQTVVKTPSADLPMNSQPNVLDKTIYIGTTKEDLLNKVYGTFSDLGAISVFHYFGSSIFLSNNKVIGWDIKNNNLKVNAGEKLPSATPFTLGSSEEDVIRAMGTPDGYGIPYGQDANTAKFSLNTSGEFQWRYGDGSYITLSKNLRVIEWYSENGTELKVSMGNSEISAPSIKLGSSLQDIIKAYGTPRTLAAYRDYLKYKSAFYKNCMFTLDKNDKVIGWINTGSDKIDMGSKQASASPIWVGSTMQEVVSAMGTPDKVEFTSTWYYGSSHITFDSNWVVNAVYNTGNLLTK